MAHSIIGARARRRRDAQRHTKSATTWLSQLRAVATTSWRARSSSATPCQPTSGEGRAEARAGRGLLHRPGTGASPTLAHRVPREVEHAPGRVSLLLFNSRMANGPPKGRRPTRPTP